MNEFSQRNNYELIKHAIESLEMNSLGELNPLIEALEMRHESFKKRFFDVIATDEGRVVGKWIVWAENAEEATEYIKHNTHPDTYQRWEQLLAQPLEEDMYERRAIRVNIGGRDRF